MNIVNIYGCYNNRVEFWDAFKNFVISKKENLIIGGDLNFTLGAHEIWGPKARTYPLAPFFINLLQNLKLIDLDPIKLNPYWTNIRVGEDIIAKRLDRFLLAENILDENLMFKQWVDSGADSNHLPICIEILKNPSKQANPFKLCSAWLKNEEVI